MLSVVASYFNYREAKPTSRMKAILDRLRVGAFRAGVTDAPLGREDDFTI